MTKPSNIQALEKSTGIAWEEWLRLLAPHRELDHAGLAQQTLAVLRGRGTTGNQEWWAQGVAVAYEQHIGRRQPGQSCEGTFQVTVSRTLAGDMDTALAAWQGLVEGRDAFDGVKIERAGEASRTEKWRYWRCGLADGTKVNVNISAKPGGAKSALAVNHTDLADGEASDRWRAFWKEFLSPLS